MKSIIGRAVGLESSVDHVEFLEQALTVGPEFAEKRDPDPPRVVTLLAAQRHLGRPPADRQVVRLNKVLEADERRVRTRFAATAKHSLR